MSAEELAALSHSELVQLVLRLQAELVTLQTARDALPAGWDAQAAFGPQVVALAGLLHEQHHLAYERLLTVFAEVFGLTISEGALVAAVARLGAKLAPMAETIADDVRAAAVVGSDET